MQSEAFSSILGTTLRFNLCFLILSELKKKKKENAHTLFCTFIQIISQVKVFGLGNKTEGQKIIHSYFSHSYH